MRRILHLIGILLALAACSQQEMLQKFASPSEQAQARHLVELLSQHKYEEIEQSADPSIVGPSLHDTLVKMSEMIPGGEPTSVTLIGANRFKTTDYSTLNLTFEYNFSGSWLIANIATKTRGNGFTIIGFNLYPQPTSIEQQNRFTLSGKNPFEYGVLTLALVLPLFTLYALVACSRTKFKGRKWPWIIFVLFGVGKLQLNWATGQWGIMPLTLQLFSAGAFAPLYGPWSIAVSIPIGAIVFLIRRKRLEAKG